MLGVVQNALRAKSSSPFKNHQEGGYEARALDHSIFTQANSLEELKGNIRDAVSCHF